MFGFVLQALGVLAIGGLLIYYIFFANFNFGETFSYWKEQVWHSKIDVSIEKDGQETGYSVYQEDDKLKLEKK